MIFVFRLIQINYKMKTKFSGMLTLLLALIVQMTFAQGKAVSGNISDDSGMPVAGVNIIVQGTTNGTQSDFDGNYSIMTEEGAVLTFTYLGYSTVNQTVGSSSTVNVMMSENVAELDEVVVTAQGISREKKALGYAVSEVAGDEMEQRTEGDVARVLSGKASGVAITSASGTSGSATNVVIRGYTSINGSNQALFVVDGVPFSSDTNAQGGFLSGNIGSSRFLDLDPNNIASVNVLKGLAQIDDKLKDNYGKEAVNKDGLMQRSIREIKNKFPDVLLMTDVALDPYSIHGHDGVVENGKIINDATIEILSNMSLTHVKAGADFVAPSDMMDGRVKIIRETFESNGYHNAGIMSYSAKYASCFYGPFRDALNSRPGFGDKKEYQMDFSNRYEALREVNLDIKEGADIVMVKPGISYLDIIRDLKNNSNIPVSTYQVSGEYAMIKLAAKQGWIDEDQAILETSIAFKRAGASFIASYFAEQAVKLIS